MSLLARQADDRGAASGERLVGARSQLRADLAQEKLDVTAAQVDKQVELVVHEEEAMLLELFASHRLQRRVTAQAVVLILFISATIPHSETFFVKL